MPQKITLMWYAKTAANWKYFPVQMEKKHGTVEPRHGWVKDKGVLVEYPTGRYVLRSYKGGKKVYSPLNTCHPMQALMELAKAQRAALKTGTSKNRLAYIRPAMEAYIADRTKNGASEAAYQARTVLDEFLPLCDKEGISGVRGITKELIFAYHKKLRNNGLSERTLANKHNRLRSWLRFCGLDTRFMPDVPRYEKVVPQIYSPKEVKAILDAADEYMGVALRMALMLGLREQEIMYAEWSDIDWHHSVFRVQGKRRKEWKFVVKDFAQRELPIPQELLTKLTEWHQEHQGTTLIAGNESDKPEGHLLRKLKQLANRAGLNCNRCDACDERKECERWYLHKFRATFCTRMLRQTDARTVQYLAGHSNIETTLAYLSPATGEELQAHANAVKWTE